MLETSRRRILESLSDQDVVLDIGGWASPHFDREGILVVDQHDLLRRRRATLRRIFRFLGVDERFGSPQFAVMHNRSSDRARVERRFGGGPAAPSGSPPAPRESGWMPPSPAWVAVRRSTGA